VKPDNQAVDRHPIRIVVADDLQRSRLTVLFRLLLAIPHLLWLELWSFGAFFAAIANWFATLVAGTPPEALHRFLSAYLRYATHLGAYVFLAANPYPGFTGAEGSYPVDLEVDPPRRQNRWLVGFRLVLAVPALLLFGVMNGLTAGESSLLLFLGVLAWFAIMARGRAPLGLRNLVLYCLRYGAQVGGYLLVVTDRYPQPAPTLPAEAGAPPPHPIGLTVRDDLRRSRLTVFFRILLAIPHIVWFILWSFGAFFAVIANWFATLFRGSSPTALHRFLAAYVRYSVHLVAYVTLMANPFPGFAGAPGTFPVDVEIALPERQNRWMTGFRLLLAIPGFVIQSALALLLYVAAFLAWFAALATGRMPAGLRDLGVFALRYSAQIDGYLYLLTERYPFSGPPTEKPEEQGAEAGEVAPWPGAAPA
jgi:Domain of unknown function (DUF4389)